jgi:hypothetical protein
VLPHLPRARDDIARSLRSAVKDFSGDYTTNFQAQGCELMTLANKTGEVDLVLLNLNF